MYLVKTAEEIVDIYSTIGVNQHIDMTDSDGDGLADTFETAGMKLSNGEIIYTDPNNADTDGDGIRDGDEIFMNGYKSISAVLNEDGSYSFSTNSGFHFSIRSDPTMKDTDGDGYKDNIDPRPLKSDVTKYSLKNEKYVQISCKESFSYGGNQNWFCEEDNCSFFNKLSNKDCKIKNFGCGLIAATDMILYEKLKSQSGIDYFTQIGVYNNGKFSYDFYKKLVYYLETHYFNIVSEIGVNGFALQNGMNSFCNKYSLGYLTDWGVYKDLILPTIIENIKNDHPVIISVAPSSFSNNIEFGNYKDGKFNYINRYVIGHYMTVTGVYVDDVKNETYLRLSSWGSEYYIKFNDYIDSINTHQYWGTSTINIMTELFNNILYIY